MMFREKYIHMIDQIHPSEELICEAIKSAHNIDKKKCVSISSFSKPATAIMLLFVCMSLAVPALAATSKPIYQLMYLVSPSIAQFFIPVQKSDEDNGIKMEVLSAYIHNNVAEIYILMQDVAGDRIDDTIDLFDSYSINRPFDSSASCRLVGYDDETKTATFLISITEWGNQNIAGDKITFSVKEFLSHKMNYSDVKIPIDLSFIATATDTQKVFLTGGSGKDYHEYNDEAIVLTPSQSIAGFPVDGIDLTAIGYINDKLHVQMALNNNLKNDNNGSLYLKDADGRNVECNYNIYFTNHFERLEDRIDYNECIFDISHEKLRNYSLYGDFVTSGMITEGNWRVTFPLEKAK